MEEIIKLLEGHFDKDRAIAFVNSNKNYFESAIKLAISDNNPFAWRAAWILNHSIGVNDSRILPFVNNFIDRIDSNIKDGHQREIVKILLKVSLNDEQEGRLFDLCMKFWEEIKKTPSIRAISFSYILKTIKKYPELNGELEFFMQNHYLDSLSPGIKKSIEKQYADYNKARI